MVSNFCLFLFSFLFLNLNFKWILKIYLTDNRASIIFEEESPSNECLSEDFDSNKSTSSISTCDTIAYIDPVYLKRHLEDENKSSMNNYFCGIDFCDSLRLFVEIFCCSLWVIFKKCKISKIIKFSFFFLLIFSKCCRNRM